LYAANVPSFVVDAYTKRVFSRHGLIAPDADYHAVQKTFMDSLPADAPLYNEFHALIVRVSKEYCRKKTPLCTSCPLDSFLPGAGDTNRRTQP
jgi:endonuclease-3 related protein